MHTKIQIFRNEVFGEIRTLTNEKGETFFVGKDVAKALGYSNTSKAIQQHVDKEDKSTLPIRESAYETRAIVINESGLYSLILSSKLEQAREFKRWVTSEVLPQIRITGGYIPTRDAATGRELTDEEIVERAQEILGRTIGAKNEPNRLCLTATQVATMWGIGVAELNGLLLALGVIERRGGRWHLHPSLQGQGLTEDRHFFCYSLRGKPRNTSYLVWTPEGVAFLEQRVRWLAGTLHEKTILQLNLTFAA